ncbi:MAG TPA: stage II sporulation protein M, partial [Symbiobacteriaceae bacterium]|nr:stage II sporulation protein M [Symbiobacteriaceae bacterium]
KAGRWMNQDQFVARRQAQWQALSTVLGQLQGRGARRLPPDRVAEVGRLYRQTASDLAYARTYYPGSSVVGYLNQLVSQAHAVLYAEEPQRLRSFLLFYWETVPQTIRRHWKAVVIAFALLALGMAVGCLATLNDPDLARALVDEQILERVVTPQERYEMAPAQRPVIGTMILLNNVKVSVLAFGLGLTMAVGTVVILFYNGLMVGAVLAHSVWQGNMSSLWAHLMAHGSLELMAIFLCGAGGLVLGWSIVAPGDLPRRESVTKGGREAVIMVMGAIPFLIIAAIIESQVTPSRSFSDAAKYGVAVGTGLLGLCYWAFAGRRRRAKDAPAP